MYLYLDSNGLYVAGTSILPAGKYLLNKYEADTIIEIVSADTQRAVFGPIEVTNVQLENDSTYASLAALLTAVGALFK